MTAFTNTDAKTISKYHSTARLKIIFYNQGTCFYSQHFWHQMCVGFFSYQPILQLSAHQLDVQQFNSILTLTTPEVSADLQVKGSVPTRLAPTLGTSHKSQASCTSDWQAINQEFPWPPPSGLIICQNSSQTQEHILLNITSLLWRIQLRNRQMEEMHRARCRERGVELLCPLWAPSQHLNQEALWTPSFRGF